jgi:hypothetical protein
MFGHQQMIKHVAVNSEIALFSHLGGLLHLPKWLMIIVTVLQPQSIQATPCQMQQTFV